MSLNLNSKSNLNNKGGCMVYNFNSKNIFNRGGNQAIV